QVRDPERRAEAHFASALHAYMRNDYEGTLTAIEGGLTDLQPDSDGAFALRDLRTAALALAPARVGERASLGDALTGGAPARDGDAAPDPAIAARSPITLAVLAAAAATAGAPPAEVRALAERIPRAALAREVLPGSIAASFAVTALVWSDELEAAEAILDVALPAARDAGSLTAFGSLSHLRSLVRLRQGRLEEAIVDGQPPLDLRREGWETYRSWTTARLAQAHVARGELERAAELVSLGLDGDPRQLEHAFVLEAAADLALARGDAAAALARLTAAGAHVARWDLRHPGAVAWQAQAALAAQRCGERERAVELAAAALTEARAVGAPRPLALALRATAAGSVADAAAPAAEAALTEAVAVLRPTALRLELTLALVDLGALLRRDGRARAARAPLREGLALAERCTAAPLAARAHDELLATGGRRVRARPLDGPAALTPTERRVAELAAAGSSNAEIAAHLFVTVKTVEWHLGRTYRKLGITSRRALPAALAAAEPTGPSS
ncbi:MAG TPA: helix-turn-helix transcriptional regulator, partial [Conexibacter sp.]|nr:helix-turn-helix transcriptional regulator [Conexibacter sp.]